MNTNIDRLQQSFLSYRGREMDNTEIDAADKLTAISMPLDMLDWRCTDGEVYSKGCNAVSHQVGLDSQREEPPFKIGGSGVDPYS